MLSSMCNIMKEEKQQEQKKKSMQKNVCVGLQNTKYFLSDPSEEKFARTCLGVSETIHLSTVCLF